MDRVRRLFSNLQCCKSGTEADSLKSRNDKYLIHVVDSTEEDYGLKALASPRGGGGGGAFGGSSQSSLVRSRSCPEISEHNYDGDGSPAMASGDGKWPPPHHHSSSRGGGVRAHVGGCQQLEASRDNETSQEKCKQQQQQLQQQEYRNQRRRRQKRSQQYEYQYHHYQYQRRSADESQRFRGGPRDGGGGGGAFFGGGGGFGGGRMEFVHAAGDYCGAYNLPERVVSSAPGGVGRS